jgi:hypothetical protein
LEEVGFERVGSRLLEADARRFWWWTVVHHSDELCEWEKGAFLRQVARRLSEDAGALDAFEQLAEEDGESAVAALRESGGGSGWRWRSC